MIVGRGLLNKLLWQSNNKVQFSELREHYYMNGYIQFSLGAILVIVAVWFFKMKIRSLAYLIDSYGYGQKNSIIKKIETSQRKIRHYICLCSSYAAVVVVIIAGFYYSLIPLFKWLEFSFPEVESGYEAGIYVLQNFGRLLLLVIIAALALIAAAISGVIVFGLSFVFLVFGSFIQIPFIVHYIMTGIYVSPSWIDTEYFWVPITIGVISFTVSDIADICIFSLDRLANYNYP